jgi:hypothetical protein
MRTNQRILIHNGTVVAEQGLLIQGNVLLSGHTIKGIGGPGTFEALAGTYFILPLLYSGFY